LAFRDFPHAQAADPKHALAMHGETCPARGLHRPCATPIRRRPKGGRLVQGILGTFDSLNPLIVKGLALPSIRGYVIESLMARAATTNRSRSTACWHNRSRPIPSAVMSFSISIRRRASPTASE